MANDVETKHPNYRERQSSMCKVQEFLDGKDALTKSAHKKSYLPPIHDQTDADYSDYFARAWVPPVMRRTVDGLLGLLAKKVASANLGPLVHWSDHLNRWVREAALAVIRDDRSFLVVDLPATPSSAVLPEIRVYDGRDVTNWSRDRLLVLRESAEELSGRFEVKVVDQYRVYEMTEGAARVSLFRESEGGFQARDLDVMIRETPLDQIPAFPVGAQRNGWGIDPLPLSEQAHMSEAILRNMADYERTLKLQIPTIVVPAVKGVAQPPPFIMGDLYTVAGSPSFQPYVLEANGQSIPNMVNAVQMKLRLLSTSGARMLSQASGAEKTATEVVSEDAGEESVGRTLARNLSAGFTEAARYAARLMEPGVDESEIYVTVESTFDDIALDSQSFMAWTNAYLSNAIPLEMWFHVLKTGEQMPPELSEFASFQQALERDQEVV